MFNPAIRLLRYFSVKAKDDSKSELLNSYGTDHPRGPNLRLSYTIECMKQTVKTNDLQLLCSTLSKNS